MASVSTALSETSCSDVIFVTISYFHGLSLFCIFQYFWYQISQIYDLSWYVGHQWILHGQKIPKVQYWRHICHHIIFSSSVILLHFIQVPYYKHNVLKLYVELLSITCDTTIFYSFSLLIQHFFIFFIFLIYNHIADMITNFVRIKLPIECAIWLPIFNILLTLLLSSCLA